MVDVETERKSTSLFAVTSLVIGLVGFLLPTQIAVALLLAVLAVVFGHLGDNEVNRGLKVGRRIARAGLIIGYFNFVVMFAFYLMSRSGM
jgi:hypothetical protein